jgi:hypothetical protein
MFNPLLPDLSDIKDPDLDNKISELTRKYFIAVRGGNGGLGQQILVTLEAFKSEQQRRHISSQKALLDKQNKDLDDLIKVN